MARGGPGRHSRMVADRRARPSGHRGAAIGAGRDAASVALVTVMWANNEVGTLQPVHEVAAAARPHGIPVHSDAVQAVGQVPVDFGASGLAAMSVSGHKVGGPMGARCWYAQTSSWCPSCMAVDRSATCGQEPWTLPARRALRNRS